jgi:hypothetical protein
MQPRFTCLALGLMIAVAQSAQGQPAPSFKVLKLEGTTQEKTTYQAISARFQAKAADTAFLTQLDKAVIQSNITGARTLLANVAQVPSTQIFFAPRGKIARRPDDGRFSFASAPNDAMFFYLLFTVGKYVVCVGDKAACTAAMKALGVTNFLT